jgi:hypothetical protein
MEFLEAIVSCPMRTEMPYGPRSQGCVDLDRAAELQALMAIPSLSCATFESESRAPDVLRAVHRIVRPETAVFDDATAASMFAEYLLDMREAYRVLHSPGKRPWPVFMHACESRCPAAPDCDAIFALTGVHVVGKGTDVVGKSSDGVRIGDYLAGSPLDTKVLMPDGRETTLLRALPDVSPIKPSVRGEQLAKICHDTACATRIMGARGLHRRMKRDELLSEAARRSAEITHARRHKGAFID